MPFHCGQFQCGHSFDPSLYRCLTTQQSRRYAIILNHRATRLRSHRRRSLSSSRRLALPRPQRESPSAANHVGVSFGEGAEGVCQAEEAGHGDDPVSSASHARHVHQYCHSLQQMFSYTSRDDNSCRSFPPPPDNSGLESILRRVRTELSSLLGAAATALPLDSEPLLSAGLLNSTGAVQLTAALEVAFGVRLPPTLVFDYPSLEAIAERILAAGPQSQGSTTALGLPGGIAPRSDALSAPASMTRAMRGPAAPSRQLLAVTAASHVAPGWASLEGKTALLGFAHDASARLPMGLPEGSQDRVTAPPLSR